MPDYFDNIFSEYLSGFGKGYGCHHVSMRMIENWKIALDNESYCGPQYGLIKSF